MLFFIPDWLDSQMKGGGKMTKQYVMTRYICDNCGHVGSPFYERKGNPAIEVLLWLFFLIPGLIYSVWRSSSRYPVCPKCQSPHMIPGDAPKGKKMLEERGLESTQVVTMERKHRRGVWIFLAVVLILFVIFCIYAYFG